LSGSTVALRVAEVASGLAEPVIAVGADSGAVVVVVEVVVVLVSLAAVGAPCPVAPVVPVPPEACPFDLVASFA